MTAEIHDRFAEVSPHAFKMAFFQDGHDLSENQLKTLGDFVSLPFLQEDEAYSILVRYTLSVLNIYLIVR